MRKDYPVNPCPKPRMTRRDKWAKRTCVLKYRAFKDEVRLRKITLPPAGAHVTFVVPMPASWSKNRRAAMLGKPHKQRPDVDNFGKALFDAIYDDDSGVYDIRLSKVWGDTGGIIINIDHTPEVIHAWA